MCTFSNDIILLISDANAWIANEELKVENGAYLRWRSCQGQEGEGPRQRPGKRPSKQRLAVLLRKKRIQDKDRKSDTPTKAPITITAAAGELCCIFTSSISLKKASIGLHNKLKVHKNYTSQIHNSNCYSNFFAFRAMFSRHHLLLGMFSPLGHATLRCEIVLPVALSLWAAALCDPKALPAQVRSKRPRWDERQNFCFPQNMKSLF